MKLNYQINNAGTSKNGINLNSILNIKISKSEFKFRFLDASFQAVLSITTPSFSLLVVVCLCLSFYY